MKIYQLKKAFREMTEVWLKDSDFNTDLNEFLKEKYPFSESLDESNNKVYEWAEEAEKRLLAYRIAIEISNK